MKALVLLLSLAPTLAQAYDCRANIKAAICVADPSVPAQKPEDIRCVEGAGDQYVHEIEVVHDELPAKFRQMFCHIRHIFIVDDLPSTALSVFNPQGHMLVLNKERVFGGARLNDWLQRKDQNAFGLTYEAPLTPKIPKLEISLNTKARAQLMVIFIHEFAHLLDYANNIQRYWTGLSWLRGNVIRPAERFSPKPPCFYECLTGETWRLEDANVYYERFIEMSGFVSLYAAVDPGEDFAETMTYFYAETLFAMRASLTFENGKTERLDGRRRKKLAEKFDFVKAFSIVPWEYGAHNLCAENQSNPAKPEAEVEGCPGRH